MRLIAALVLGFTGFAGYLVAVDAAVSAISLKDPTHEQDSLR
jgi:hypothetical protein